MLEKLACKYYLLKRVENDEQMVDFTRWYLTTYIKNIPSWKDKPEAAREEAIDDFVAFWSSKKSMHTLLTDLVYCGESLPSAEYAETILCDTPVIPRKSCVAYVSGICESLEQCCNICSYGGQNTNKNMASELAVLRFLALDEEHLKLFHDAGGTADFFHSRLSIGQDLHLNLPYVMPIFREFYEEILRNPADFYAPKELKKRFLAGRVMDIILDAPKKAMEYASTSDLGIFTEYRQRVYREICSRILDSAEIDENDMRLRVARWLSNEKRPQKGQGAEKSKKEPEKSDTGLSGVSEGVSPASRRKKTPSKVKKDTTETQNTSSEAPGNRNVLPAKEDHPVSEQGDHLPTSDTAKTPPEGQKKLPEIQNNHQMPQEPFSDSKSVYPPDFDAKNATETVLPSNPLQARDCDDNSTSEDDSCAQAPVPKNETSSDINNELIDGNIPESSHSSTPPEENESEINTLKTTPTEEINTQDNPPDLQNNSSEKNDLIDKTENKNDKFYAQINELSEDNSADNIELNPKIIIDNTAVDDIITLPELPKNVLSQLIPFEKRADEIFLSIAKTAVLPIEVVESAAALFYLIWVAEGSFFAYCSVREAPDKMILLLRKKSITKICWLPYYLYAVSRTIGLHVENVHSIHSVDMALNKNAVPCSYDTLVRYYAAVFRGKPVPEKHMEEPLCALYNAMPYYADAFHAQTREGRLYSSSYSALSSYDAVLGVSYFLSLNFNTDKKAFRISTNSSLLFHPVEEMEPLRKGCFVTYSINKEDLPDHNPKDLYKKALVHLEQTGRFRKINLQLIYLDEHVFCLFIEKKFHEYISASLQQFFHKWAIKNDVEQFALITDHRAAGSVHASGEGHSFRKGAIETLADTMAKIVGKRHFVETRSRKARGILQLGKKVAQPKEKVVSFLRK